MLKISANLQRMAGSQQDQGRREGEHNRRPVASVRTQRSTRQRRQGLLEWLPLSTLSTHQAVHLVLLFAQLSTAAQNP